MWAISRVLTPGMPDVQGIVVWEADIAVPKDAGPLRLLPQEFEQIPFATVTDPAGTVGRRVVHIDWATLW